ncbi:hypothetical protein M433DRAFT_71547 [Acidomyces richmondensis BFW]|nr:MAG: hypothetical protein FE78DRAFT_154179 [Acidomyces sp. 'richmondensis']KYG43489.1 hypothetical protein M433DRAFT_71547 [Acidomyces richmondensis BFW]
MTTLLPVALWGLEVPPEVPVSGEGEFPAAFRITMAAIDPSEEMENEEGAKPRATLKIHRMPMGPDDDSDDSDDDDDDSFDQDEMERILAEEESSEDDDDEEVNGGPSDPAKKKAAKGSKMDVDTDKDIANGVNGIVKSAKAKGKMPASDEDEDEDEDEDGSDLDIEPETFVLCTLDPEKHYQQPLDIVVGEGERVWFEVSGTHTVYLTGNYVEPDYNNNDMFDPEDDDEEDYDLEPDLDELDEDEDELDDLKDPRVMELDGDDSDEEEETPKLITAKDKKNNKKRPAEDDATEEKTLDEMIEKEKLSKKQQKKLKKNDGTAAAVKADDKSEPSSAKSDKKVSFAKNLEQGPTPTKDTTTDATKPAAGGKKIIQGVEVDDKKIGTGPAAKIGDRVGMRYIGKLAAGGQQFDANKKGKPFTFKLGAGMVIKGWEIGIQGMSVGGERRITIPPHLGYGAKRHGDIPPNSTLVFDVKLIELNKGK